MRGSLYERLGQSSCTGRIEWGGFGRHNPHEKIHKNTQQDTKTHIWVLTSKFLCDILWMPVRCTQVHIIYTAIVWYASVVYEARRLEKR